MAENTPKAPEGILPHEPDYHPAAWTEYTLAELGWWVHLLAKRAEMRANPEKRKKDLIDARNYLAMMIAKLDALELDALEPPS